MGNFVNINMVENQYHYQKEMNERTVALVHDVSRSSQGSLSFRAFRLSAPFMAAYREGKFTTERWDIAFFLLLFLSLSLFLFLSLFLAFALLLLFLCFPLDSSAFLPLKPFYPDNSITSSL